MSRYANRFTMGEVRRFWDGVAAEYERENERVNRVHTQRFREAMKRMSLGPGMRVLNVWARTGGAVPYLRGACGGLMLVNAELSFEMLKIGRRHFPEENFVQTSLHDLPFEDEAFDAVLSLETLEHVPDPLRFLTEIRRILADGGPLVMSLPPSTAEWTSFLSNVLRFHHGEGPHRFLAPREVKAMLAEAGFRLERYDGTLFLPLDGSLFESIDGWLGRVIGRGALAQFGLRQFYVCTASS